MKKMMVVGVLSVLMSACAVGGPMPKEDGGSPARKLCATSNAMYKVTYQKLDGNCPSEDGKEYFDWVDENNHLVLSPNCTDHSDYDGCTTYINQDCKTWVYDSQLYGQLYWAPGGHSGSGVLTFVAFERQNGYLYCSSQYQVDYVFQWSSPMEDGGTE